MSDVLRWVAALQQLITSHAGAPWTYWLTAALCWLDGFFPPVPSETVVLAMATLATHRGPVNPWALAAVTVVGACLGDNTAYWLGRLIPSDRLLRGDRGRRLLARTHRLLDRHGPEVLLTARFVPGYRVAVNFAAGSLRYPVRHFIPLDALSALLWVVLTLGIGLASGTVFANPLVGIAAGIVVGGMAGALIGRLAGWLHRRAAGEAEPEDNRMSRS